VEYRSLAVPDSYEFTPVQHADDRGVFLESYRADALEEATGRRFDLRQSNVSVSARGVARGIHFADVPLGQAKYVTAISGSILDFIVDIRVGSPTFGAWDAVELTQDNRKAVFLAEGLGHLFIALTETATVHYLASDRYRPGAEHAVNPTDPAIGLDYPLPVADLLLSPKDAVAPTLAEAAEAGLLPSWQDCLDRYAAVPPLGFDS
jgi:dTDP-4-dehydrorhamnose 3,5-epimerase